MADPILTFSDFKRAAADSTLSDNECCGFSDEDRFKKEVLILKDWIAKLSGLQKKYSAILDIGTGCTLLPELLDKHCSENSQELTFIDSKEVLSRLQTRHANLLAGQFPQCLDSNPIHKKFDSVIVYSVIQYVYRSQNIFNFLDHCLNILSPGGELLIGDIPNISMKTRFYSSDEFPSYHKIYYPEDVIPTPKIWDVPLGQIDDSIIFALLHRARQRGFHSWVVPQPKNLPFGNRREDILIRRP